MSGLPAVIAISVFLVIFGGIVFPVFSHVILPKDPKEEDLSKLVYILSGFVTGMAVCGIFFREVGSHLCRGISVGSEICG